MIIIVYFCFSSSIIFLGFGICWSTSSWIRENLYISLIFMAVLLTFEMDDWRFSWLCRCRRLVLWGWQNESVPALNKLEMGMNVLELGLAEYVVDGDDFRLWVLRLVRSSWISETLFSWVALGFNVVWFSYRSCVVVLGLQVFGLLSSSRIAEPLCASDFKSVCWALGLVWWKGTHIHRNGFEADCLMAWWNKTEWTRVLATGLEVGTGILLKWIWRFWISGLHLENQLIVGSLKMNALKLCWDVSCWNEENVPIS